MSEQTIAPSRLTIALVTACAFAREHGVEHPIDPSDFAIQRSDIGYQRAIYADADRAVTVTIDPEARVHIGVAELYWIHDEGDDEREPCDYCEPDGSPEQFRGVPLTDVYLPGDAPKVVAADA